MVWLTVFGICTCTQMSMHAIEHGGRTDTVLRESAHGGRTDTALRESAHGGRTDTALRESAHGGRTDTVLRESAHGGRTNTVLRETALEVDSGKKNPLPHRGLEPASVLRLAFQSDRSAH